MRGRASSDSWKKIHSRNRRAVDEPGAQDRSCYLGHGVRGYGTAEALNPLLSLGNLHLCRLLFVIEAQPGLACRIVSPNHLPDGGVGLLKP